MLRLTPPALRRFSQASSFDVIYGGVDIGETFQADSVRYLPPIQAESADYKTYLDDQGKPLEVPFLERRQDSLLDRFSKLSPDLILVEAFPFGRRMVRNELDALLTVAKERVAPPLIVSSVRDILQEGRKPGRNEETVERIDRFFDHVLVHSDPGVDYTRSQ